MAKELPVTLILSDERLATSAYVSFDKFDDPLVGMEKLMGAGADARIQRDPERATLKVDSAGLGEFRLRLDRGETTEKLVELYSQPRSAKLEGARKGDAYSVVINHEEQYSVRR